MEAFSDMKAPAFVFDLPDIQRELRRQAAADRDATEADRRVRKYYQQPDARLVWIDRAGVDHRADTLLAWLHTVRELGFTERAFGVAEIEQDVSRLRQLDFDDGANSINSVAARLEYRLTKACVRYAMGQRYGFLNPYRIFNELDVEKTDTVRNIVKYRELFDVDMELPAAHGEALLLHKIHVDSLAEYLREVQPAGKYYQQLKDMLPNAVSAEQRQRIVCNMERARWRRRQPLPDEGKRIVVNIPAYHLYAYSADTALDMRVVCGTVKTKTPLLSSYIEWMEVNPQWVIPMSIIENEVSRHAGDSAFFARNRYHIYERTTGKELPVGSVSQQMLVSGKYKVAQEGGQGNSLGRIVFRFKNKFSVFLHDTSNPGAFSRESRAVSHGCVRVAKPFELASFVLDAPDEWLQDRIRISMGLAPVSERGRTFVRTHESEEDHKLIGYVPVKPRVPIYIIYHTLWPTLDGGLATWPDVYGYDQLMWQNLQPYLQ